MTAAVEMQTVMAERNHHLPSDRAMHFRMGIHMGDVIIDEDEVFGEDVNIAVRLESVAPPGGIAVSEKAHVEAGKRLSVTLRDTGPHRFKNIADPIRVYSLQVGVPAHAVMALAQEAVHLGSPGPDSVYGFGLVGEALRRQPVLTTLRAD